MAIGPGSCLDAYELVVLLGSGGMGEVWLAIEARLRRKVALKLLPAELTRDPGRVARFEHEARAASALNHPNVCTIHALGATSEGQHYIAMEQNVLVLHHDVAAGVAQEIRRTLTPAGDAVRVVPEAFDAYVRGRYFWNLRNERSLETAIQQFERAIAVDPKYAPAYAGLADAHFYLWYAFGRRPPRDAMPRAREAALKALALDDRLAEGHTSLAVVRYMYDWDWTGAEEEFRRAIALNPSYSLAHHAYAVLLMTIGRREESVAEAQRALTVDPLSMPIRNIVGTMLRLAGRHDDAIASFRRTLELYPNVGTLHSEIGETLRSAGRDAEALSELLAERQMDGSAPEVANSLRDAYERDGWRGFDERELELARARYDGWHWDASTLASLCARTGRRTEALHWLRVAFDARSGSLVWLPTNEALNRALKDEPAYRELLTSMRLPAP